ncbi:DUF481 domain-containing protein [Mucilaginibacter arboris]|uniref:DUF481 domain-containing protein n=1 Tax=Mucilaginibacter arboris TaxID=2682090 RepID=A0A7K1T1D0_9SPHI|nr:DUF481 domain-containing protein [Mucilaginibacter arboris]MVN23364.1 DUF481 domain-containing protein [Mucilaginibacter arboris]
MYRLMLLLGSIFWFTTVRAQFNDSTHYHTSYASTGSINRTNDGSSYLLNNAFKFNIKNKRTTLNFNNSWVYGRSNGNLTNNDFSSSLDFDLNKQKSHFYYWGLANYNTSFSLKINNQLLAGLGVAYNILDKKNAMVNVSDGALYDLSNLYISSTENDVYDTYRNSFRLNFRFAVRDLFVIDGNNFLQNSVETKSDYIIRSTTNLSFKLRKWLAFTTSFNYNRVNRTHSENVLLNYGLTMEKYF